MKSHIRQFIEKHWHHPYVDPKQNTKHFDDLESELTEAIKKDEEASGQNKIIEFIKWLAENHPDNLYGEIDYIQETAKKLLGGTNKQ